MKYIGIVNREDLLSILDELPPQEGEVKAVIEGVKKVLVKWIETGQMDKEALEFATAWTTEAATWSTVAGAVAGAVTRAAWIAGTGRGTRTEPARIAAKAAAEAAAKAATINYHH